MSREVIVVVGVGGMGGAIARRQGAGRQLLLSDLDQETLEEVAATLGDEGFDVATAVVDVSSRASVAELAATALALGPVTQLVHTAGLSPVQAATEAILRVDLLGVALVLDEFGQLMADGGAGVVIASGAAYGPSLTSEDERLLAVTAADVLLRLPLLRDIPDPGVAYGIAKRGNLLRVQAASLQWSRRGARVNSISPGVIATPMSRQELDGPYGDYVRSSIAASPAKRIGTPTDIADAAAFLLGPSASFITGTDLLVDGGSFGAGRVS